METESLNKLLTELINQENELQFSSFSNDDAFQLGTMILNEAKSNNKSVTIDISLNNHCLFHYAMTGTSIDNAEWIRRKKNVVNRFRHSSFFMGTKMKNEEKDFYETYSLPEIDYAAHGGAFPLIIKDVGVVGSIAVSGLPQQEDHELVVKVINMYLEKTG